MRRLVINLVRIGKVSGARSAVARITTARRGQPSAAFVRMAHLAVLLTALLLPVPAIAQTTQVVEYYHTDVLGSVRAVTNQQGQVIRRHDFLPFGEELQPTVPPPDKPLFTGKERDAETGLDYFGARYQRAGVGRFTSVDPAMTIDENLVDPQRWNRYAYARTNPLRYTDPDGRFPLAVAGAIIGGITGFGGSAIAQWVSNGHSFEKFSLQEALAAGGGGAVSGGLAGLTLGGSLFAEASIGTIAAVNAGANVVGGAVSRAADGRADTGIFDFKEAAFDAAAGGAGGWMGAKVGQSVRGPIAEMERNLEGLVAAADKGNYGAAKGVYTVLNKVLALEYRATVIDSIVGAKVTNIAFPVASAVQKKQW